MQEINLNARASVAQMIFTNLIGRLRELNFYSTKKIAQYAW